MDSREESSEIERSCVDTSLMSTPSTSTFQLPPTNVFKSPNVVEIKPKNVFDHNDESYDDGDDDDVYSLWSMDDIDEYNYGCSRDDLMPSFAEFSDDGKDLSAPKKNEETDYISKFLNGELSFTEYAARMEKVKNIIDEEITSSSDINVPNEAKICDTKSTTKISGIGGSSSTSSSNKKIKKRYVRRNLPPALKGLMGEANLRYARGDKDTAVKICLEIIRQVPTAPEPYHTLAGLYDELGHPEKSLQMSLIAAHLSPSDPDQWIHLAEVSQEKGNIKQAITCYTKALRADQKNSEIHFKRAELLEKVGQKSIALKGFSKLLTILNPKKEGEHILQLSKLVAEMYHREKDLIKTRETLEIAFNKCPQRVTSEHVNLLLEVLLTLKEYMPCLNLMMNFCNLGVLVETDSDGRTEVKHCIIPETMMIDIKVKLMLVLIHMKSLKPIDELLSELLAYNPDEFGDLYLDVAEAFMAEQCFDRAFSLLSPLISSGTYSMPAVWLRYGECLKHLGVTEQAALAYLHVVEQAPQHHDARLVAADLLTTLGRRDEAIKVLTQDEKCEVLDAELLYERCLLLKDKPDRVDDFLAVCRLFLSRHFIELRRFDEVRTISFLRNRNSKKLSAVNELRLAAGLLPYDKDRPEFMMGKKMPPVDEEWNLFMYICNLCFKQKKFTLLQRLVFSAQGSPQFFVYKDEIDLVCLMACYYNRDTYLAFNYARTLVIRDINLTRPWNLFNMVLISGDDTRHNRFIMRLLTRNQNNPILSFLHANNCLVSGTYKYALNEYAAAFRKEANPFLAFLIGVTLCQMACQKFSAKKHSLVSQCVAFFSKYFELRGAGGTQEYNYNLARVYHQLGLLPAALCHYKLALESRPSFIKEFGGTFDLSREAAFNIHLIYMQSGSHDTARMYLEKYITV